MIKIIIGYLLDLIIGDPQNPYHPIRGIGKIAQIFENLFRKLKKHSTKSDIFLNYDIYKINNYNVYFSNSINLFNKEDLILIDEIYFQSLENIKQMKENLGKTKDKKDIKKIDIY